MAPSDLVKRRISWAPYAHRPGYHPVGPYDLWARAFACEQRVARWWRWHVVAPARRRCGLPHTYYVRWDGKAKGYWAG